MRCVMVPELKKLRSRKCSKLTVSSWFPIRFQDCHTQYWKTSANLPVVQLQLQVAMSDVFSLAAFFLSWTWYVKAVSYSTDICLQPTRFPIQSADSHIPVEETLCAQARNATASKTLITPTPNTTHTNPQVRGGF